MLVNLALNARDAMTDGGTLDDQDGERRRGAGAERRQAAGSFVVLSVADSGCGMDAATRARIFEPFFTTKETHGNGLGLASVYGIVAQSGGFIDVTSAHGRGNDDGCLPAARRRETTPSSTARWRCPYAPTGGETILLVEDEDGVRAAARRILAAQGYTVLEAFDGAEALTARSGPRRRDRPAADGRRDAAEDRTAGRG